MNKGLYAFAKGENLFIVICKPDYPNQWQALRELDGCEVESGDYFYIMGTDARAELKETFSEKLFVFRSNDTIYFECPICDELVDALLVENKDGNCGFCLIQSEFLIDADQAYEMFIRQEIEGLICCFYTEKSKREIFNLDQAGNIISLR